MSAVRVLFVVSELPPWAKVGGLGDVAAALPRALRALGADVRLLMPDYLAVRHALGAGRVVGRLAHPGGALPSAEVRALGEAAGVPLYTVNAPALFHREGTPYADAQGREWPDNALRFGLLSRVAAHVAQRGLSDGFRPDVTHCNDWPTGLVPAYLRFAGAAAPTLVTVHNLAHQGLFDASTLPALDVPWQAFDMHGVEYHGRLSFLKAALYYADRITTVSPRYAQEIQTEAGGCGLHGLLHGRRDALEGILNGIDADAWNPATDPLIDTRFDAGSLDARIANKRALQRQLGLEVRDDLPLFGVVSRITHQKGSDLILEIADRLAAMPAQLAVLGTGDRADENAFLALAGRHPGRVSATVAFQEPLAHRIEAGADVFLMPSRFEPCGLNQMYSMRYGAVPVVRATGGLADTVIDCDERTLADGTATGFSFDEPSAGALLRAVERAVAAWRDPAAWRRLQRNGMTRDFGWAVSARRYLELYRGLAARGAAGAGGAESP